MAEPRLPQNDCVCIGTALKQIDAGFVMRRKLAALAVLTVLAGGFLLPVPRLRAQEPAEQGGGGRGQFAGMQRVGGEVTAIAGATLTIKTEDGGTAQIVTTDNTRVMKGRGVTVKVADLKVGDQVAGQGALKSGVFVPAQLTVATPGQGRRRGGEGGPNGAPGAPPAPGAATN